jgi:hypothetical protein
VSTNASKRIDFPIVGSYSKDTVLKVSAEDAVNWYESLSPYGKKQNYLAPWPGLRITDTFSVDGVGRASYVQKNELAFAVVADTIYTIDDTLVINAESTVFTTTTGFVDIAGVENQVAFVDGVKLLLWDGTTVNDETANLPTGTIPIGITSLDGFFVLIDGNPSNPNHVYISDLNDGTAWSAPTGNFALVNSRPTILSACITLKRNIFLFGEVVGEVWNNQGQPGYPFRRVNSILLEHGVKAKASLVEGYDKIFYLSHTKDGPGSVMMCNDGSLPEPISTKPVDETIQSFADTSDARGQVFRINGQIFYVLSFTNDNLTFVYNVDTQKWSRLEMLNGSRYVGEAHFYLDDKHLMLGVSNNHLYELNSSYLDNEVTPDEIESIHRCRIAHVFNAPTFERVRIDRFQVDMLQGVGLSDTTGEDANPDLFLSISEDGGATYINFERQKIGKAGDRLKRTIWRNCGVHRDAILKIEMYNKVKSYVLGAAIDYEVLPE